MSSGCYSASNDKLIVNKFVLNIPIFLKTTKYLNRAHIYDQNFGEYNANYSSLGDTSAFGESAYLLAALHSYNWI